MHVSAFTCDPYIGVRDKHAELGFYRCDGESVTTTINVDRFTSQDPSLVIDISVNEFNYVSYLCGVDYMSSIEDNGRILGYVNFSENCNQALIVFNPPPAIGARITIHIDNGTNQTDYGPYFIGQEGECCKIHHIHCKYFKISFILPNKWQLLLCM